MRTGKNPPGQSYRISKKRPARPSARQDASRWPAAAGVSIPVGTVRRQTGMRARFSLSGENRHRRRHYVIPS
ncbi:hypothetical protein NB647_04680 [Oxalobacter aliiformigenes]|uniref:hypothetical protein n=1 Tax=Oxalobacter aliiformigenes TaxID=2946593 RepID=UPI0022AE5811|nr:hypothetical protein [Oxalobacter aliiformigenes]WAV90093.1 hypothetical protein NB647_04680 [Oxalobacter aliiformigenes]